MTSYRAYAGESPPTAAASSDNLSVCLGLEFYVSAAAWLTHVHWWQATSGNSTSARTLGLYRVDSGSSGPLVAGTWSSTPSGVGWQTTQLPTPYALTIGTYYRLTTLHPDGCYCATGGYYSSGNGSSNQAVGPVTVTNTTNTTGNDQNSFVYSSSMAFPNDAYNATNYWNDITVSDVDPTAVRQDLILPARTWAVANRW